MKRVSVLLSSYNGEKYIEKQIRSVLQQEDVAVILTIRDDGSQDSTLDIIRRIDDKRIKIIVGDINLGPAMSFLDLLSECGEADYYAFCDQDDIWETDKIKRAIEQIGNDNRPALYYSSLRTFRDDTGNKELVVNDREFSFEETFIQSHFPGCTMVWNKSGMEMIRSIAKPSIVVMHDVFIAQLFMATDNRILYDRESRINYRIHGKNVSVKKDNIWGELNRYKRIWNSQKKLRLASAIAFKEAVGDCITEDNRLVLDTITEYNKSLKKRIKMINLIQHTQLRMKIKMLYTFAVIIGFY